MKRIFLLMLLFSFALQAQNYYCVIISGSPIPHTYSGPSGEDAFWNDAFVFWKYCKDNSYSRDQELFMLFYEGYDPTSSYINTNYLGDNEVTYGYSSSEQIHDLFTSLADGLDPSIPQMHYNDVLIVYIKGHGGVENGRGYFKVYPDGKFYDDELKQLLDYVPCKKRIIINSTCYSGAFKDEFQDSKTIFISASDYDEPANYCDDIDPDGGDPLENDEWVGVSGRNSHHGELDYHLLNALLQRTMGYYNELDTDQDNNGEISVSEMLDWALLTQSSNKTPQYSWYGNLASRTYINPYYDKMWENTLVLTESAPNPYLVWGAHDNFSSPLKYKIYRQKSDASFGIGEEYIWIGETSSNIFKYTDNAVITNDVQPYTFHYKITAVNSNGESLFSNIISVGGKYNWAGSLSSTVSNGSPRIVWIPYTFQAGTTAGYKIYRSINMQGGPPGTFYHVATVGSVVEWIDYDLAAGSTWKVYYKVKAYKNSPYTESDFTNIAESGAAGFQKESLSASEKPDEFQLEQCYPNPFNPSTNIKYSIKENSMVSIKIYDILGREMKTLVNKSHTAGRYNIKFDAAELAAGIYIYKIQAGDFTASRKMNLVK